MLTSLRISLSDDEWEAILPHLPHATTRGRPCDLRAHFNAIFRLAATDGPWRELPAHYGKHDTIARHFRRLTHAGLWERLPNYPFDKGRSEEHKSTHGRPLLTYLPQRRGRPRPP